MKPLLLLVDDEASFRQVATFKLTEMGYETVTAENGEIAYSRFLDVQPHVVLSDLSMPQMDGLELTRRIAAISDETPVIIFTAFGDIKNAVSAMKLGAVDYLTKPIDWEELKLSIERALRLRKLVDENRRLKAIVQERHSFDKLIGSSAKMRQLYSALERVAATDATVLLLGETGTGKELVARAIHLNGPRRREPFITVNCGAIPESLLEAELFGYRQGAFTGAVQARKGIFEQAHMGTILLDEIAELPQQLQVKLLRVLQEGELLRLGESLPRKIDVRVIAATNRDLPRLVADGTFREDLYFRLNVIQLKLPPLRARREDIPILAQHFLQEACTKYHRPLLKLNRDVLIAFDRYPWPGNVRELRNTIERLVIMAADTDTISISDLPEEFSMQAASSIPLHLPDGGIDLEEVEKEIIKQALERNEWNQTRTARYLNITRNTLIYRMQKFGLIQNPPP